MYPHDELAATDAVGEMLAQAQLGSDAGFDGVMTSEHHGGFPGYVPNPLQLAGWCLERMTSGWAAACPLLLPLRPAAMVVEETAWLAARFPGRVGLGVAAGSLVDDFEIMGLAKPEAVAHFAQDLALVASALSGLDLGALAGDRAVQACIGFPVPVVSAAMSPAAVRRAAGLGVGILLDSLSDEPRARDLVDAYRQAGGAGPVVLIRRAWVGAPPTERQDRQVERYRGYAASAAQDHWRGDQVASGDPETVAERLLRVKTEVGADCLNVRFHVPGITPGEVRDQIEAFAAVRQLLRV